MKLQPFCDFLLLALFLERHSEDDDIREQKKVGIFDRRFRRRHTDFAMFDKLPCLEVLQ